MKTLKAKIKDILKKDALFENLTNEEIKEKYIEIKNNSNLTNDSIVQIIKLSKEAIKRFYSYDISSSDLKILDYFLECTSLNISYDKMFYAFLIYCLIKNANKESLHCIFANKLILFEYYEKVSILRYLFDIDTKINEPQGDQTTNKDNTQEIYSSNLIFSTWQNLISDYLYNQTKAENKTKISLKNAFIFDIDKIIYDFEKCTYQLKSNEETVSEIVIKDYFKQYQNILGVSKGLFFEKNKIENSYNLRTKIIDKDKKILKCIAKPNDIFFQSKDEKMLNLVRHIDKLHKENKTVVIDVDSKEELNLLESYLKLKKLGFTKLINDEKIKEPEIFYGALTHNNIVILGDLLSSSWEAQTGGDWNILALLETNKQQIKEDSQEYFSKYNKEIIKQIEIHKNNIQKIKENGGIHIIFTQHYLEIKNEYLAIKNYSSHTNLKNVFFYNSPEDELYQHFNLQNIPVFNQNQGFIHKLITKLISQFLFISRKRLLNGMIVQNNETISEEI